MSTSPPPDPSAAIPGLSISTTGKLMLAGVVAFFFIFVLLLILILRANRYSGANPTLTTSPPLSFSPVSADLRATFRRRALEPALLKSLPITIFNSETFKDGVECAVCLSELADGDAIRLLPGCLHGFHLECINKWLCSNSTCPICRSSIADYKNVILGAKMKSFTDRNGSGEGSSAFVLPSRGIVSGVEIKGPNLRSLRRILSMGSRGFSSDCGFRESDVEQGVAPYAGDGSDGEGSSSDRNCERDLSLIEEVFFVEDGKKIAMR